MRTLILATLLLCLPAGALAADSISFRTIDAKGEMITGTVKELQRDGVLLEMEKVTAVVAWKRIHPADRYRLRASVTSEKDAAGRLKLAESCLAEAWYEGARAELERALALGHRDSRKIQKMLDTVDLRECEGLHARFEEAVSKQEYDAAIAVVRTMATRFPSNPLTREARGRVPRLLRSKEAAKAQAERDAAEAAAAEKQAKRQAWIAARFAEAEKAKSSGKDAMVVARRVDAQGNITRARKGYEEAERRFLAARRTLLRIRRATRSGEHFDRADRDVVNVESRLLDVYLGLAGMYVGQKNFKRGVVYVDRALLFDPVNPEALRLSELVRKGRITRSMRGITNAREIIR